MKLLGFGLVLVSALVLAQDRRPSPQIGPPVSPADRMNEMQRATTLLDRPLSEPAAPPHARYTADTVKMESGVVHLTGHVRIESPGFIVFADSATYAPATGDIHPSGNVRVKMLPTRPHIVPLSQPAGK